MTKRNFKSVKSGEKRFHSKNPNLVIDKRRKRSTNAQFMPGGLHKHENMWNDPRLPLGYVCGRCGSGKEYKRYAKSNRKVLKCQYVSEEKDDKGNVYCQIKDVQFFANGITKTIKKHKRKFKLGGILS